MTKVSMHQQGIIILNMFAPNSFKMHEVKHKRTELDKSIIMVRDSNIPFSKWQKIKKNKDLKMYLENLNYLQINTCPSNDSIKGKISQVKLKNNLN